MSKRPPGVFTALAKSYIGASIQYILLRLAIRRGSAAFCASLFSRFGGSASPGTSTVRSHLQMAGTGCRCPRTSVAAFACSLLCIIFIPHATSRIVLVLSAPPSGGAYPAAAPLTQWGPT